MAPLLVAAGAVLVYLNSLVNGFAFDDLPIIVVNPAVHDLADARRIWLSPYWPGPDALARGLYRPLTVFLFALQWKVGGGTPLVFHLANLVLHAWASVLVYHLVRELAGWKGAFGAALLFAVHPVHVEAVANGVGQAELVSTCCVLMAVALHARRPRGGSATLGGPILLSLLFVAGLLAKENAIVLPVLLLAVDLAQGRDCEPGYRSSVGGLALVLLGIACSYLLLRSFVLGGTLSGDAAFEYPFLWHPPTRVLTALSVWPHYLRLLVFPLHLSAMYDPRTIVPVETVTPGVVLGSLLLALMLASMGLRRAWPALGLGSAWFLFTILPASNLFWPVGTLLAERTLYLPSVALVIWVGFALRWPLRRTRARRLLRASLMGAFATLLLAFSAKVVLRNPVWASNEILFGTTLRDHPESFRAQWFEALRFVEQGDPAGSLPHWRRALELYQGSASFLTAYANFLLQAGNLEAADELAARSLELRPDSPNGLFVKGVIEIAGGRRPQAMGRIDALRDLGFPEMATALEDRLAGPIGRRSP